MRKGFDARRSDNTPLYVQFADDLRQRIEGGAVAPGHALPSERDLSETFGMSRVTVRRGIGRLIEEGLVFRKQGSGTYVALQVGPGAGLNSFTEDARKRGANPSSLWIMRSYAHPTEEEAELLGIAMTAQVARLGRVRLSGGEPLAIEHAVVPREFLPALDELGDSLYESLERLGNRPVGGTQRVRASTATPLEAGMLSISRDTEVLRIERHTKLADGRCVEVTRSVCRGDRYELVLDLGPDVSDRARCHATARSVGELKVA